VPAALASSSTVTPELFSNPAYELRSATNRTTSASGGVISLTEVWSTTAETGPLVLRPDSGIRTTRSEMQRNRCLSARGGESQLLLCVRSAMFASLAVRCFLNSRSGYMEVGPAKGRDRRS
jgi:hypothetical protein